MGLRWLLVDGILGVACLWLGAKERSQKHSLKALTYNWAPTIV
jgi:hypothetical protein